MEISMKFGFKHFFLDRGTIYLNQKFNIGLERLQIDDV